MSAGPARGGGDKPEIDYRPKPCTPENPPNLKRGWCLVGPGYRLGHPEIRPTYAGETQGYVWKDLVRRWGPPITRRELYRKGFRVIRVRIVPEAPQ